MPQLDDMLGESNSFDIIKEKFLSATLDNIDYIKAHEAEIINQSGDSDHRAALERYFNSRVSDICYDDSLGSNGRWGIVSRKNVFGLRVEMEDGRVFLKGMSGRFQMDKFSTDIFPNGMDISDILERGDRETLNQIIEEFYNMNNREFFEKYGVNARGEQQKNLLADCLIIDSLLEGKDSEIQRVYCGQPGRT